MFDGQTGDLWYAGIDRPVGGKALNAESFDSWGDVNGAFKYWEEIRKYEIVHVRV